MVIAAGKDVIGARSIFFRECLVGRISFQLFGQVFSQLLLQVQWIQRMLTSK
jgi:hypothetical protein